MTIIARDWPEENADEQRNIFVKILTFIQRNIGLLVALSFISLCVIENERHRVKPNGRIEWTSVAQPIKDDQSIINLSKLPSVDEVIAKVEKENNLDVNQSKTIAPISIEKSSYNLPKPKGNGKFDRIAPDTPKEKSTPNNMQTQQSNKQFTNDPSVPTLQSRVGIIQREIALPTESQLKTLGDALLKKPTQHTNNNASNVTEVPTIPRSYITPHNSTRGKRFQVEETLLRQLGIPPMSFVSLNEDSVQDMVIVTGADGSHYKQCLDHIGAMQHYRPHDTYIYYDFGLSENQKKEVKQFCNVEYRKFDFTRYPSHVRQLRTYSFKILSIWEVLQQYSGAMWLDCSARMTKGSIKNLQMAALKMNGAVTLRGAGGSIYSYTLPGMFEYLPVNLSSAKQTANRGVGTILIYKSEDVYWNILHWWLLCGLEEECIAPKRGAVVCLPGHERMGWDQFYGCHRYDQSLMNILFSNWRNYDVRQYSVFARILKIVQRPTYLYNISYC